MIHPTGIWTREAAEANGYPHSPMLLFKLTQVFEHDHIIDFGAGDCFYINHLCLQYGCDGIDGFFPPEIGKCSNRGCFILHRHDLSKPFSLEYKAQVLSLEVGEHIPAEFEQIFIDNLCNHCNSRMVLSWAIPGQGGIGHVNCRPNDYVIEQLTKRGFAFKQDLTDYVRADIERGVRYFADTLMVFDKK